jgi:hypothetical protein
MRGPHRLLKPIKPTYSRFGNFFAISLIVFAFVVVPIKLAADASPLAALIFTVLAGLFVLVVAVCFIVPVTPREATTFKTRRPMELDPTTFDPTKDGVSW